MQPAVRAFFRILEHLLLAAAVLGLGLLLTAGHWLQASDSPAPSEAMVVLGGNFHRPAYAAELFRLGMAGKVYVARVSRWPGERVLDENGIPFPRREEVYRSILVKKGVPAQAVEYFGDDVLSTVQEAETLSRHLAGQLGRPPRSLLVVTAPYHVRRTRMVFESLFPGTEIRVVGAPAETIKADWWTDQESSRVVLLEIPKIAHYLLGGRFRSGKDG